jgi:hypothetical protein
MRFVPLVLLIVALSAWVLGFAVTIRSHNNVITQAELAKAQGVEAKKKKVAVKRPRKRALHAGAGFLMPPTPEPATPFKFPPSEEWEKD